MTRAKATLPLATRLNEACQCIWVDRARLAEQVRARLGSTEFPSSLVSGSVVFADPRHVAMMNRTIRLITDVVANPAFERRVVAYAPEIARTPRPTSGGVLGFDFHLGGTLPQLIEVNTNPGGLLISLETARAAAADCDCLVEPLTLMGGGDTPLDDVAARIVDTFFAEFARARPGRTPHTIAIVDDEPQGQYLFPEFLLYQRLFERAGLRVLVVDAASLALERSALVANGERIDLVYNRCTDFYFSDQRHAALRDAYEHDLAVITPGPAAHARWSDKRLLEWLRDEALLSEAGLPTEDRQHLKATIPATELVNSAQADALWSRRKGLFFKPVDGFGGKAAYRGDKLTRGAFEHVLAHRYVAQAFAPASSRRVAGEGGGDVELRLDVRNYAMDGQTWLRAARLYRGQTTNFRTAGGGFAPVLTLPN
jgi:hypothetical protein